MIVKLCCEFDFVWWFEVGWVDLVLGCFGFGLGCFDFCGGCECLFVLYCILDGLVFSGVVANCFIWVVCLLLGMSVWVRDVAVCFGVCCCLF